MCRLSHHGRTFTPFPSYDDLTIPIKVPGDWDDIPTAGINHKTSINMQMDVRRQKKALGGYYACVSYMDAQVGKVMQALRDAGLEDETIVIFTSDHGYHLGEHDFWAKVSLRDESAGTAHHQRTGKQPAVCDSFVELLDLYPTISYLCGLDVPERLQGQDISPMLDDPTHTVREARLSVAPRERAPPADNDWAYIQYEEDASAGIGCSTHTLDRSQFHNLAS
ncbi:MAG: sulfatase-like hydrolase/transferase [Planctomycetaceae bacterium]